jgi:hypothetical protein
MDTLALDDKVKARRTKRRHALMAILLGSSLATLGAGAMSLAMFTDSKATTGSWTSGSVTLGVSPATSFTAVGIMPGDTGTQTITVTNSGTGALRYAVSTSATNADTKGLAAQMTLTVKAGTCPGAGGNLYSGALGSTAIGSNVAGAQAGDRTLAAAASEPLCFAWLFPTTSGNTFQTAATTATFTFDAEQTANNP